MDNRKITPARAKLSDVARLAGVSAATVSRVLSHPDLVAEATRATVMEAVAASGYRINHAARNLRKQRTGCVVALVPNLGNPFFAKILDGMGRELAASGYDLLIADTLDAGGRHMTLRRFLDSSRADGIILLDGLVPRGDLAERGDLPPLVMACEWIESMPQMPRVVLDNRAGGRLAIEHLRGLGHSHLGLIGGPEENVLHQARLAGARDALGDARLTLFPGDFTLAAGQQAAKAWQAMPDRPSAVFALSDEMACAFMATLQRAGVDVPGEVSIIGFDDIELVSHLAPALTTIRQPKREIGRQAAQVVLARIEGREVAPVTLLAPRLMLRETTAPARDHAAASGDIA